LLGKRLKPSLRKHRRTARGRILHGALLFGANRWSPTPTRTRPSAFETKTTSGSRPPQRRAKQTLSSPAMRPAY